MEDNKKIKPAPQEADAQKATTEESSELIKALELIIEEQQEKIKALTAQLSAKAKDAPACPEFEFKGSQYRIKHGVHVRTTAGTLARVSVSDIATDKKLQAHLVETQSSAVEKL